MSNLQTPPAAQEYESLRAEILKWQEYRFTVLTGTTTLVTAILALDINKTHRADWPLVSAMLLSIIACACGFTWYCGRGNAIIGAYLAVEHKSRWELKLPEFNTAIRDTWIVNHWFGALYLVLAILSALIPSMRTGEQTDSTVAKTELSSLFVFYAAIALFIRCWLAVMRRPSRSDYQKTWVETLNKPSTSGQQVGECE